MRVTINVLYREALYLLKEKGYKISSHSSDKDAVIINYKSKYGRKDTFAIEKDDEGFYVYSIITCRDFIEIISQRNHLANLRLFIEREL